MVKRTTEQKYNEHVSRGLSPLQIRAIARAMNDEDLIQYVAAVLAEEEF